MRIARNLLAMVGISGMIVLFIIYWEEAASVWTTTGAGRSATTTDTVSYDKPAVIEKPYKPWPKLDELLSENGTSIKQDVQFVLDFAIIGHPKCATTFTMNWLASHEEIQMHREELPEMHYGAPAQLIATMYKLEHGYQYKRGYKSPRDIASVNALTAFAKYFPGTKLIIGVRHPVLWFQSFYNFRVRKGTTMPPPESLMGKLEIEMNGVSTDEAAFHVNLDNLGKTNRTPEEQMLLGGGRHQNLPRAKNLVFLYELNQLHDYNVTRANQYLVDLQHYLGLEHPLVPITDDKTEKHDTRNAGEINICEMKYRFIRAELMMHAINASRWIREYFLKHPDVRVSSPEYFYSLVEGWMKDPCEYS